jgi:tetratricopeptide (TPR) repeat protein
LTAPDPIRYLPVAFTPDGARLVAIDEYNAALHVWDLRAIRAQLKELSLDWDWPDLPAAPADEQQPVEVNLVGLELLGDPKKMAARQKESAILALAVNPFDAQAHNQLGESLLESKNLLALPAAYSEFSLAIICEPDLTRAYQNRMRATIQLGLWKQVLDDAAFVLKQWPNDPNVRFLRAQAFQRLGRHKEAIDDFSFIILKFPNHSPSYRLRADSLEALGRPVEAQADRAKAAVFAPPKK